MQIGRARRFWRERFFARTLAGAVALAGAATASIAADISLDSAAQGARDAISNITTAGVTIYGTIDVGYGFDTHGLPVAGSFYPGLYWNMFGSTYANKPISTLTNNALEQSKLGVKVEEKIYDQWTVIAKAETAFDPAFGELADACATLVRNNGKTSFFPATATTAAGFNYLNSLSTYGDGSRCGQAFNGPVYAGVSNPIWGTLTFGRQQSLALDVQANYDPMQLSYAFSIMGYSGRPTSGFGATEAARWDESVKYVWQYGPVHVAGMYADGGPDSEIFAHAWGANAGFTYGNFALDAVYTVEDSVIRFGGPLPIGDCTPNSAVSPFGYPCNTNSLPATVQDSEGWFVTAKYTIDLVDCCSICCGGGGGLKDQPQTNPKLTLYAGYEQFQLTNPRIPVPQNDTTIGGYFLYTVNNTPFGARSAADYDFEWTGARLVWDEHWSIAAAYYRWAQARFLTDTNANCAEVTAVNRTNFTKGTFMGNTTGSNCSGNFNQASFLVDYTFNKYFDVYAGVTWSDINGGLDSGYLYQAMTSVASGIRLRF